MFFLKQFYFIFKCQSVKWVLTVELLTELQTYRQHSSELNKFSTLLLVKKGHCYKSGEHQQQEGLELHVGPQCQ